jgi:teichuronic acid exporter
MDIMMLGKFSTAFNVGLYNRSGLLVELPVQNISNGLTQVLFTRFSRASAQGSAGAFDLLARCQRIFLAIVFPLCAGAAGAASCIVLTLYGTKWSSAIPVFAILCAATAANASFHLPAVQMEALGRFRHKMIVQLLYLICIGGGLYLSVSHGLVMVCLTITGLTLIRSFGLQFYTAKYLNRSFTDMMSSWVPGLTAAIPVGGAIVFVAGVFLKHPGVPTVMQIIVCILVSLGVSSAFYGIFYRKSVFDPLMTLMGIRRMKGPDLDSSLRVT